MAGVASDGPAAQGGTATSFDQSGARDLVRYMTCASDEGGTCSLEIGPWHLNRLGLLHGGFVSMLIDNGCGAAVRNALNDVDAAIVTVSLSVNFIAGARTGRVTASGRVTGGGKSIKFADAELRDESGRLLATGSATFRVSGKR